MKIKRAWFLGVDGEIKALPELEGKECNIAKMYPIIGCDLVEHVGLGKGVDMWVNEEGLYQDPLIMNTRATELYRKAYPLIDPRELVIVGNVIVTDNTKNATGFNA
jgi:hypothetical protein